MYIGSGHLDDVLEIVARGLDHDREQVGRVVRQHIYMHVYIYCKYLYVYMYVEAGHLDDVL